MKTFKARTDHVTSTHAYSYLIRLVRHIKLLQCITDSREDYFLIPTIFEFFDIIVDYDELRGHRESSRREKACLKGKIEHGLTTMDFIGEILKSHRI